ncbi:MULTISPECIES: DUF3047 domain-containing protein [Alcaligenaceae]|uniref:DUF3047 domain-containing protein n=1 Tax=Alcaligenaceae TaxID=506 RepID=UPI0022B3ABE6|nr:DUF3047 domain-containing protein [Castellaniella sp. S9]
MRKLRVSNTINNGMPHRAKATRYLSCIFLIISVTPGLSQGVTEENLSATEANTKKLQLSNGLDEWDHVQLNKNVAANQFEATLWDGQQAIKVQSRASMSLLARPIKVDLSETPLLCWRWRIDAPLKAADMTTKAGDDYAARLYVSLALPEAEKGFLLNAQLAMARAIWGPQVPDAAINYVWDNRQPVGTERPNAYTDRTTMVVLQSGPTRAGGWVNESRHLPKDMARLYSANATPVQIALAADTDNTGEAATAGFTDIHFAPESTGCTFPASQNP